MSAMVESSVSPERCERTAVYLLNCANWTASSVSVREPIWFTFTRMELAVPVSMPFFKNFTLVTKRSSPTSCTLSPILSVNFFHVVQSLSPQPSSMETMGLFHASSVSHRTPRGSSPADGFTGGFLEGVFRIAGNKIRRLPGRGSGRCPCRVCNRRL